MQKDTGKFLKSMEAENCGMGGLGLNVIAIWYFLSDMALDLIEQCRINHILSGMIKGSDYFSTNGSYTRVLGPLWAGVPIDVYCEEPHYYSHYFIYVLGWFQNSIKTTIISIRNTFQCTGCCDAFLLSGLIKYEVGRIYHNFVYFLIY